MNLIKYYINSIKAFFFNDEALNYIDEEVSATKSFFAYLGLVFILNLISLTLTSFIRYEAIDIITIIISVSISLFILIIMLFFLIGMIHLFLKLFQGKGTFSNTFKFTIPIYNCSYFILFIFNIIFIFTIPSQHLDINNLEVSLMKYLMFFVINLIIWIILFIWIMLILLKIYSTIHNISKLRVFISIFVLLPIILFILLMIFYIFLSAMIITSSISQSKSFDVGRETQEQITSDIEIIQVLAQGTNDGKITANNDNITLVIRLVSGSSPVKLEDLLLRFDTMGGSQSLTYSGDDTFDTSQYGLIYKINSSNHMNGYLGNGDLAEITFTYSSISDINGGETATLRLLTKNGAVIPRQITTPAKMEEEITYLYP